MDELTPDSEYVPFGSRPARAEARRPVPRSASTKSSVLIAVLPLIAFAIDVFVFSINAQQTTWTNLGAVTLATLLVSFGLAKFDQRRLAELGLLIQTSAWIALICPVAYLFVRGSRAWRETSTGLQAAWLNVLVIAIVGGLLYELPVVIAALDGLNATSHS